MTQKYVIYLIFNKSNDMMKYDKSKLYQLSILLFTQIWLKYSKISDVMNDTAYWFRMASLPFLPL
jgi:hypothetical protein